MMQSLISIIIPCYNAAPWLHRCLDSVLAQTYDNWEALLINDGSTDNTAEILEEYAASDVRFRVIHQQNKGLSGARNTGLRHMKGEWMTWLDADDTILPEHLSTLEAATRDGSDFVVQKVLHIYEDGRSGVYNGILPHATYLREDFATLTNYLVSNAFRNLYASSIISKHQLCFRENIVFAEDMLFNLEYLHHAQKATSLSEANYQYFMRGDLNSVHLAMGSPEKEYLLYEYMRKAMLQLLGNSYTQVTSLTSYFRRIITSLYRQYPLWSRKERVAFLRTLTVPPLEPKDNLLYHRIALLLERLHCYGWWDRFNLFCYHRRFW